MQPSWQRVSGLASVLDRLAFLAFLGLALVFPFERIDPVIVLAGLEKITTVELPMRVGTVLWMLSLLFAWRRPRVPAGLAIPALVWLFLLALASWLAPLYGAAAAKFTVRTGLALLAGWAVYDLVVSSPQSSRRWRWLAQAMALAGLAVAVAGLLEATQLPAIVGWLRPFKGAPTRVGEILRISSTLPYATIAAMVLELTLPLTLAWTLTSRRRWARVLLGLGLLAGLTTLALTLTRAGVLALLAALLMMAVLGWRWRLRSVAFGSLATAGALSALVVLILVYNPTTALRFRTETEQTWYQAAYRAPAELTLPAGAFVEIPITVTNTSVRDWDPDGPNPFQLSYHLLHADGRQLQYDGPRSPLPRPLRTGERLEFSALLQTPSQPGTYVVEWDMVQEGIAWFSWQGATPARTRLVVVPSEASALPVPSTTPTPGQVVRIPPPGRIDLWRAALRMAADRPWLGVGPDNFRLVYGPYAGVSVWNPNIHANNLYLEWLAGTGLLGLLAFLWLNVVVMWRTWQSLRPAPGSVSSELDEDTALAILWRLAVFAGLTAWFVHGLFDSFYEFTPTYMAFWLLAALGLSGGHGEHPPTG